MNKEKQPSPQSNNRHETKKNQVPTGIKRPRRDKEGSRSKPPKDRDPDKAKILVLRLQIMAYGLLTLYAVLKLCGQ